MSLDETDFGSRVRGNTTPTHFHHSLDPKGQEMKAIGKTEYAEAEQRKRLIPITTIGSDYGRSRHEYIKLTRGTCMLTYHQRHGCASDTSMP